MKGITDSLALAIHVEKQGRGIAKQSHQAAHTRKEDRNIGGMSLY